MEVLSKPVWCYSGAPIDLTWANDAVSASSNAAHYALSLSFSAAPQWSLWTGLFWDIVCETF
jgi:hypothetical protein